jgi:hypothetical protein
MAAVAQAALPMRDPADLIKVAIEHLMQQRGELPAFSTLDRLMGHLRHRGHQTLDAQSTAALPLPPQARLDTLLPVHDGLSEFTRMKAPPRQATLAHLRQWLDRLTWLEAILTPHHVLAGIAPTKVRQLAAEAAALDLGDMRDIEPPRPTSPCRNSTISSGSSKNRGWRSSPRGSMRRCRPPRMIRRGARGSARS